MAKEVIGYMTRDGVFYEDEEAAKKHEYRSEIETFCVSHTPKPINPVLFIGVIEALADPIRNYIDAYKAYEAIRQLKKDTIAFGGDKADDADGDAVDEAVEQLPVSGSEHLLEMGSSSPPESVRKRRT